MFRSKIRMNKRFSDSHTRTVHAFAGQDGTQKTDNIMDKLAPNKQTLWRDCNKYYRKSENTTITLKKRDRTRTCGIIDLYGQLCFR